ncbi:xylulokinase [Sulfitobacter sp. F26204]|uniref:xylulokinase n=1 Tax=Sulfitobacter sp. F26204 TaxID=2996014 RepID=UPI00225E3EEF|nr:xylulokinase [Sulfitobacter sp. F26204]MCX7560600.1 xylulokinase [Sulfitobacter sp. F26204]
MFIGLDLGTSSLKAILINDEQNILAEHTVPLTVQRPHDGWSEQDPASWFDAAENALNALAAITDCRTVTGIGLSGHMHGATLFDAQDVPLRPCMLWNDTRSYVEADEMDNTALFRQTTGNIVFPGFTAPKVEWLRRNEPDIFDRATKILLPKDALRLFLTGESVSEMSDAAGTAWLDTGKRDWSEALLDVCHLTRAHMPALVEGSAPSGKLRPALAAILGADNVTVAGGAGDNAAAAIGAGVIDDGTAFLSLGTSGVLFAANNAYRPSPASAVHSFCHAVPDTWHQMGVILAATDALEWLARLTGQTTMTLTEDLGALKAPAPTLFLPYLGGERTPHNNAQIRGQFLHLDHATDAAAATRAVLEGVAYAFADCRDALVGTGTRLQSALALGGGAKSDYWLQVLATVLDIELHRPAAGEFGAALGAARLAMMATIGADQSIATMPPIASSFEPNQTLKQAFAEAHHRYQSAYSVVKDL